jgi:MoxR-like ATPase
MLRLARSGLASTGVEEIEPVTDLDELRALRAQVDETRVTDELARYVVEVVRTTRNMPSLSLGASPRATVHLLAASRAAARLAGRDFVTPDDVVRMAPAVLRHRVLLTPDAELDRQRPDDAVAAALDVVPVPR